MSHWLYRIENRRIVTGLAICLTALYAGSSYSRPDMRPLGPNIADEGSSFYHFTISKFDSVDGKRHYKVWTAVPDKAPPKAGFPVLYLLDGNSAMARLSEPLLKKLSEHSPPVLVAIGYQTALPFDQLARTLDYTPASNKRGNDIPEVDSNGRMRGGSNQFRNLLEKTIAPQVEKGLKINAANRGLWGHSYGGLFVLEAYLSSDFFTRYYSTSPSLGQGYFFLLDEIESTAKNRDGSKQLTLLEGDGDPINKRQAFNPDVLTAVRNSVNRLSAEGVAANYQLFPGLSHGPMFKASLEYVLEKVSEEGEK
ncbi:hypothetical protein NG99_05545 [Erwinia typographi]|uniref:Salmochelin siderophore protein IroE n=1 Tax=Erwinia typographi TaxID=371042 RepID=A0A0A3ZBE0_9GAMM|nr:alpha/beta hydrolase-fold protein [Erwinia typographi]KGT95099.1 hypothetical protein NG99_05545 [Erwinia typographi]